MSCSWWQRPVNADECQIVKNLANSFGQNWYCEVGRLSAWANASFLYNLIQVCTEVREQVHSLARLTRSISLSHYSSVLSLILLSNLIRALLVWNTIRPSKSCQFQSTINSWLLRKCYLRESKVLQYLGNVRHNLAAAAAADLFAKVMKVMNPTELWDAKIAWYSSRVTWKICLYG